MHPALSLPQIWKVHAKKHPGFKGKTHVKMSFRVSGNPVYFLLTIFDSNMTFEAILCTFHVTWSDYVLYGIADSSNDSPSWL